MEVLRFLLKIFGWVPIPKFTLKYILKCLPEKYKKNFTRNFLDSIEEENFMPEFVQLLLDQLEKKGYNKKQGIKFKDTEEEVEDAMVQAPQLRPYKVYFLRWCKRKRKEAELPE